MDHLAISRRTAPTLLLLPLIPLLLACSAAPAQSPPPSQPPDRPVTGPPGDGSVATPGDDLPGAGGQMLVEPEDGLVDLRPVTWERIEVSPDGMTLTVAWYGGVDTCYGLADVEVERRADGTLAIGLWEGSRPDAVGKACIEIAVLKQTQVQLDTPLIIPLVR